MLLINLMKQTNDKLNVIIVNNFNIMIKFTIKCKCGAKFEGQFPNLRSFNLQKKKGLIECPLCDSGLLKYVPIKSKVQKISKNKRLST